MNTPQIEMNIFTTLKYQNKQFCFLEEHLTRLFDSLRWYKIKIPQIDFEAELKRLMKINRFLESRIRIVVSQNGELDIQCQKLAIDKTPRTIKIFAERRKNLGIYQHKCQNLPNVELNKQAKQDGFDDYLFIDEKERILETTFCNIFFVKDNEIFTPPSYLPILPGIMRAKILEQNNVSEREIFLNEISQFDEIFVTNAIHGRVEVKEIIMGV